MKTPMTPVDEAERLQALHQTGILDTPSEERFDRITRIARRLFDVPVALVSLVDSDRQWFKSCFGLSVSETPRDVSFCGHAILGDEPLVIADTLADERFADNPLVTGEPGIRFYAGYPLTLRDGAHIGTLCIIDFKPRQMGSEDINTLSDLGHLVEAELSAERAASVDELTGILNRRGFVQLAESTLGYARRKALPASLVYLDLDNFKPVNDEYGHATGDQALADFAGLMRHIFRESDTLARLGGDEFASLMLDTDEFEAGTVMERFSQAVQTFNKQAGRDYQLRYSCGQVEVDPRSDKPMEEWLEEADARMYQQKQQHHTGR